MSNKSKEIVLVTGGSGLVGKAIQEVVEDNEDLKKEFNFIFLSSKHADLSDLEETRAIFDIHKPDYVINLAAKVGGLFANMKDNQSFFSVNTLINRNVIHCSSEFKVKKCLSCLSTCIFPASIDYPLDETKIHNGPPHQSNIGYSLAKRQVDLLNADYNQVFKDSLFTAIIPTNIYGRHDNFNLENSHVIPGLIHKAYLSVMRVLSGEASEAILRVSGTGKPLRQFIYAADLANIMLWTLKSYYDTEPMIICTDEVDEVSISRVAEIICSEFSTRYNTKVMVEYDTNQIDGQHKKTSSNFKFRKLYPQFKFTKLESGIPKVIDWFCSNYPEIRK